MSDYRKRKATAGLETSEIKRLKTKKHWQTSGSSGHRKAPEAHIQPGDAGIWATCVLKQESKAVGELNDLFNDYVEQFYGGKATVFDNDDTDKDLDIEAEIKGELEALQKSASKRLFENVRLDTPCVLFFRTRSPLEPVSFVQRICRDISKTGKSRTRRVKRLTPITNTVKATENGLVELAEQVLRPHFLENGIQPKTFAIRPTLRNHTGELSRDIVIKKVASLLTPRHKVDLKGYDLAVLVEVYKNVCGMSVVGNSTEFEQLKRFNLAELEQRA